MGFTFVKSLDLFPDYVLLGALANEVLLVLGTTSQRVRKQDLEDEV